MTVGSDYDPMLAKVIAHGGDRASALRALDTALAETVVLGVGTNIDFLRYVLTDRDVAAGRIDTGLLERLEYSPGDACDEDLIAAAAYRWLQRWPSGPSGLWDIPSGWRLGEPAPTDFRLGGRTRVDHVRITGTPQRGQAWIGDDERHSLTAHLDGGNLAVTLDGLRRSYRVAACDHRIWLSGEGRTVALNEVAAEPVRAGDEHTGDAELTSPMPGSVVAVGVDDGGQVDVDGVVVAVEAMKMEHALRSPVAGVVELLVALGDQVTVGQPLARITARQESAER
ncbi:MAG: acetyl/propionyl-CoA carboxylase subunit alpha, partial [Mycobacterium sp.]|nr:acetyl/propionyl-CoA carboxylase subunit alpha [Mycobacterium sp.]